MVNKQCWTLFAYPKIIKGKGRDHLGICMFFSELYFTMIVAKGPELYIFCASNLVAKQICSTISHCSPMSPVCSIVVL
jgi:hypothetical protein